MVEILWDNFDRMTGSWDAYLVLPADFVGADDIIIKGERAWDQDRRTHSLIFNSYKLLKQADPPSSIEKVLKFHKY